MQRPIGTIAGWVAFPGIVLAEALAAVGYPRWAGRWAGLARPVRWSLYATAAVGMVFLMALLMVRGAAPKPFVYAMF